MQSVVPDGEAWLRLGIGPARSCKVRHGLVRCGLVRYGKVQERR